MSSVDDGILSAEIIRRKNRRARLLPCRNFSVGQEHDPS